MAKVTATLREAARMLTGLSDTPRLDAELLMAEALGVSRSDLLLRHHDSEVPARFAQLLARRLEREPVAYILGRQEFFGLEFAVSPDVLVPRADSECVVQVALDAAPDARRILDLGTGSGALLLALLSHLPQAEGIGIDASAQALLVAAANGVRHANMPTGFAGGDPLAMPDMAPRADGGSARFVQRDWNQAGWADDLGRFDLVIANPPYVEDNAELDPDVRDFEPASALFAGAEGLDDYRVLVPQLPQLLADNGVAVLEIGALQAESVAEIARTHGFATELHQDLGGRDRALVLRLTLGKGESSS
ncbi:peptide chain release factor N(5)-glutamine methyltransferase [Aurantiacibacter gilvus]|uniref:Release factor glutamine methyltransferase n=1 Tax=Aurantiacibacter gilvus TaxID=3139141 RepID=A0ABU9IGR1_9SPHN